jgi:hypothetical protein
MSRPTSGPFAAAVVPDGAPSAGAPRDDVFLLRARCAERFLQRRTVSLKAARAPAPPSTPAAAADVEYTCPMHPEVCSSVGGVPPSAAWRSSRAAGGVRGRAIQSELDDMWRRFAPPPRWRCRCSR